jgi:hypothetical protein
MEMCMYTEGTLQDLLSTVFRRVNVWRPDGCSVLFAACH